ncbi:MAG: hypothetical protein ACK559_35970, partial [bacterium]
MAHQPGREARGNGQCGGHGADHQAPTRLAGAAGQVLHQGLLLVQDAVGRGQHLLALGRETLELTRAAHDGHAQVGLERPERIGQR